MNNTIRTTAIAIASSAVTSIVIFSAWPKQGNQALSQTPAAIASSAHVTTAPAAYGGNAVMHTVDISKDAVVSVIITKNLPVIERSFGSDSDLFDSFFFGRPQLRQNGTQPREVGGGTAFFVSSDGLLLTNKHVVEDPQAQGPG